MSIFKTDEATIAVTLSDGTALPLEVVDGQTYCIAVEGKEFIVAVTLPGDFLRKHKTANKRLYLQCYIDGISLGHYRSHPISSGTYNTGYDEIFSERWNADGSRASLMFMKLEQVDWHDVEDSKSNALKLQASKVGLIEVFIECQTLQEDNYANNLRNSHRRGVRANLAKAPVMKAAPPASASASASAPVSALASAAVAAPPVSSSSALADVLADIPKDQVPKAGDTAVKGTKEVLHRRTLTLAEGRQTKPPPALPPPPSFPNPTEIAKPASSAIVPEIKPKIWVFSEELTVLRIAYQTEKWLSDAKIELEFRLREAAARHRATFTEALDGEVEVLPPKPKRQCIIDLTGGESVTVEEASQDSGGSSVNIPEQLSKLAKLYEGKFLSDQEYSHAKSKVLGLL